MRTQSRPLKFFVCGLIFVHLAGTQRALCAGFTLLGDDPSKGKAGTTEFFAANPEDTPLINVQLWGDLRQPGIYHVPMGTTLRNMMGYIGGPLNVPSKTTIYLSRVTSPKKGVTEAQLYEISARDLMADSKWSSYKLQQEDVIYLEGQKEESATSFMDVLKDGLVILGFVSSVLTVYLLADRVKN